VKYFTQVNSLINLVPYFETDLLKFYELGMKFHARIQKLYTRRVARWFVFKPNPQLLKPFERKSFYDHLVYFAAICFISWQLGICFGNSLKYPHFGILCQDKSGNPA
jgi:hypothetical protein